MKKPLSTSRVEQIPLDKITVINPRAPVPSLAASAAIRRSAPFEYTASIP